MHRQLRAAGGDCCRGLVTPVLQSTELKGKTYETNIVRLGNEVLNPPGDDHPKRQGGDMPSPFAKQVMGAAAGGFILVFLLTTAPPSRTTPKPDYAQCAVFDEGWHLAGELAEQVRDKERVKIRSPGRNKFDDWTTWLMNAESGCEMYAEHQAKHELTSEEEKKDHQFDLKEARRFLAENKPR
jgi:hypothetical protein